MKQRPNLKNFFYLVGSGLIIQLAGTCYRIWLARRVGAEGLGILGMVYPVYRLLSGMATIGLPMALIKWISEYSIVGDYGRIHELRSRATRIVSATSISIVLLLLVATPFLARSVYSDFRVKEALLMVALAIPFSALSSIYRGYFQGLSNMAPTASSELGEQFVEISTSVLLISVCAGMLPISIFSVPVLGLTVGEIACLTTLLIFFRLHRPGVTRAADGLENSLPQREILRFSWPLLLNQIVTSISVASEGIIIPHFLIQAGVPVFQSTGMFGKLTGMAEPVAYFPLIFLSPLATVLSPQVSSAVKTHDFRKVHRKIALFYAIALVICFTTFGFIMCCAPFLSKVLYNDLSPVPLIRLSVIGLPFTGVVILNLTLLAAIGKTDKILFLTLWATGLKTCLLVFLTPMMGIKGAAWSFTITQIFIALASWAELRQAWPETDLKTVPRWLQPFRCLKQLP